MYGLPSLVLSNTKRKPNKKIPKILSSQEMLKNKISRALLPDGQLSTSSFLFFCSVQYLMFYHVF